MMKLKIINIMLFCLPVLEFSWSEKGISQTNSPFKLFAEIYNETIRLHREDDNTIALIQAIEGVQTPLPKLGSIELYLKQRYGSDANRDYWNNRGELSLGVRLRFFERIYLGIFYEYIWGKYIDMEANENPDYTDVRYGGIFWQGADFENQDNVSISFPLSFWDEVYADAIYYKRDRKNFIAYANGKFGARFLRIRKTVLDFYYVSYLNLDINGDYWNNKFEFGLGFRIKPFSDIDFALFVENLKGTYIKRIDDDENPSEGPYHDYRIGLLFWYGL